MRNVYYAILKFTIVVLAVCCSQTSCKIGAADIKQYRDNPKDPSLIGEWLYLKDLEKIKSNPKVIEENLDGAGFLAGVVYHSNGDSQVIRLHYSKNSSEPRLVREAPDYIFCTKSGVIYYIESHPKMGDAPNRFQESYMIKGNFLYTNYIEGLSAPNYERKPVTAEIFPKRVVK